MYTYRALVEVDGSREIMLVRAFNSEEAFVFAEEAAVRFFPDAYDIRCLFVALHKAESRRPEVVR